MSPGITPYKHTQIGWLMILVLALAGAMLSFAFATAGLADRGLAGPLFSGGMLLLFGSLSVTVDDQEVRARFGVGLLGKRIDLRDVYAYEVVENPWQWGWGIRLFPGGTLYNVSGLSAVELCLRDGRKIRIGTDDPQGLKDAVFRVIGHPRPLSPEEAAEIGSAKRSPRPWAIAVALILVLLVFGGIGGSMALESRPPSTSVRADGFTVKSLMYREDVAFRDVTAVTLEPRLLPIQRRTNGFAMGPTLRGHFDVAGMGNGQIFIQADRPPFVLVRTTTSFVLVGFADPQRTQDFYAAVSARWLLAKEPSR